MIILTINVISRLNLTRKEIVNLKKGEKIMNKHEYLNKYLNIVNGAFEFLKGKCLFCEQQIKYGLFCDKICKYLFFEEKKEVKIRRYVSKKRCNRKQQIYNISEMKKEVEKNILKIMRRR